MACLVKIVVFFIFGLVALVSSADWGEWAAGNGGVHDRPVIQSEPQLLWNFTHSSGPAQEGVIFIRSSDNNLLFTNGGLPEPLFWMLSPDGTELFSWNDTDGYCDGSITEKNGIAYVFNDGICALYAIDMSDGSVVWQLNKTVLCGDFRFNSASSFMWEGETHFYFSSSVRTLKIEAASGSIQWSAPSSQPTKQSYFLHPIRASDGHLVLHDGSNAVYKLNKTDGAVMWSNNLGTPYNNPNAQPAPTVDQSNGHIYVADTDGNVWAFDNDGNQLWNVTANGKYFRPCSPVLISSEFFLLGDATDGDILRFSTADGSAVVAFNNSANTMTNGTGIRSQMLWSNNVLYAVHFDNARLGAYDTTDSAALQLLWSMALPIHSHWGGGPAIDTNGNVYLSSDEYSSDYPSLVAIQGPAPPVSAPGSAAPVQSPTAAPVSTTSSATVLTSSVAVIATSIMVAM